VNEFINIIHWWIQKFGIGGRWFGKVGNRVIRRGQFYAKIMHFCAKFSLVLRCIQSIKRGGDRLSLGSATDIIRPTSQY